MKVYQLATSKFAKTVSFKVNKLSEMVTKLNDRIDQLTKNWPNSGSESKSRPSEIFTDKRLLRVKAAAFVIGRPITVHLQLVDS